ncbi:MAG: hypothetical protein M1834_000484 [Cirrosporium novae-zelandiae]|nr:MAG: hypothetical protein M1834_000484 [Cirrosporium novae-zelandiae]
MLDTLNLSSMNRLSGPLPGLDSLPPPPHYQLPIRESLSRELQKQPPSSVDSLFTTLPHLDFSIAPFKNVLPPTPPKEMAGIYTGAVMPSNYGARSAYQLPPAKPTSSTNMNQLHSMPGNTYPSADRFYPPRSSSPRSQLVVHSHQEQRPKINSSTNAIAPNLQIPSSINDSKGSLAEFAAQITCLFWFEDTLALRQVEESSQTPEPAPPLVPEALPSLPFTKWVTTTLSTTQVSPNVTLLALLFIYRLKQSNPSVKGKVGSEYRLLTVALMLGNKFLDDNTYTNKTWAEVSGISVQEIHVMEVEFLSNMRYNLYTSGSEWKEWHKKLAKFWNYFNEACRVPLEPIRPQPIAPPTSMMSLPPALPSPPISNHASPPNFPMNSNPTALHPLSIPHYLPPSNVSPVGGQADTESFLTPRKRSYEDHSLEPPAKRVTISLNNSAIPAPQNFSACSQSGMMTSNLRLPVPTVQLPNQQIMSDYRDHNHNQSATQLPQLCGRSIPSIPASYPGNTRMVDVGTMPFSTATTPMNTQSNLSSYPQASRHQSPLPYSTSSVPSPSATIFPSQPQQSNMHSPSYFLSTRSSPYRPIRGVNTLLVPPPQASLQPTPRNLNYDQMHYIPLGRPMAEARTGVVPYTHQDPWASTFDSQPQAWNSFPQPNFRT